MGEFFRKKGTIAVKICGLTSPEEALLCARAGADAIGLVFYPPSPRNVSVDLAREISMALPQETVAIGVFVDESFEFIMERVEKCGLGGVQLHGNESPELVRRLKKKGLAVIKALFGVKEPGFHKAHLYDDAHAILVEYGRGKLPGGNAESWNWGASKELSCINKNRKIIVAGGITPENALEVIETARPWAMDISSGVECAPGKKDMKKVTALFKAIFKVF
ncbi:MAG: phosphoribosylanthranilate isomerase [Desulfamplus sp.]|nr:phosphoribosylanthranilate isomerase [Desulfamplus sp.]